MPTSDGPSVSIIQAPPRAIAAVRARLTVRSIPASFATYLNQVYAAGRDGSIKLDGQNIFVYRGGTEYDDVVDAEFGIGITEPFAAIGEVSQSELPAGEAATATHIGDYSRLGSAHVAVIKWCRENKRERTGTRWEVYGHWEDDPARLRTDVFHLLKPLDTSAATGR